jgi:hypothetical protein
MIHEEVDTTVRSSAMRWAGAAFLLALAASFVLLFAPWGTRVESTAGGGGLSATSEQPPSSEPTVSYVSLLEEQGWSVAIALSIPVVVAGVGLLASAWRGRSGLIAAAILLGAWVVLGAASVGLYYLPAEGAMIVAAVKAGRT